MLKVRKWDQDVPEGYARPTKQLYVVCADLAIHPDAGIVLAVTEEECRDLAAKLLAVLEEEVK